MKKEIYSILNLWFIYITFYICFKHLFVADTFLYIIMDVFFLILLLKVGYRKIKLPIRKEWIFHIILVINMLFSTLYTINFGNAFKFCLVYMNFLTIAVCFSLYSGWQQIFYKWLKTGCLFHLAFTYFSAVFTEKSLKLTEYFLDSEAQKLTVRLAKESHYYAGIAGQTGTNAFFFAMLIGLFVAEWCASYKTKTGTILLMGCSWLGLILTGKKGLIIASLISMIFVCCISRNKFSKRGKIFFISFAFLSVFILSNIFIVKIKKLLFHSVISRLIILEGVLSAIIQKPILGNGINSIGYFTYDAHLGHNIYLQMWAEQGVIGFIILAMALLFPIFWTSIKIKKTNACMENSYINSYFSLFVQTFIIIYGFSGNPIYDYNIVITYFLALAAGFSTKRIWNKTDICIENKKRIN
ncbi:MAG: O-antigen ligase family protein [Lachnospiraceae bacterium]|nr:O-antigen ligase family protein [Lachnospiraceae bacterium]